MQTIRDKITQFQHFWHERTGSVLKLTKDKCLPGSDGVCTTSSGLYLVLKVKTRINPDDIGLLQSMQMMARSIHAELLVLTDGLSSSTAELMRTNLLNYYVSDFAAGISLPGFVYYYVQDRKPRKRAVPKERSMFSGRGSRLCRVLLSAGMQDWSQAELVQATGLNKGYVSLLMRRMADEDYVRLVHRKYKLVDFDRLLDSWEHAYEYSRFIKSEQYAVAGKDYLQCVEKTSAILKKHNLTCAFTGWTAAAFRAPYMEPPLVMAYVNELPEDIELIPVETGGNVRLFVPADMGRLQQLQFVDNLPLVSDVQAYLDLRKMPGRAVEQADHLRDQLLK